MTTISNNSTCFQLGAIAQRKRAFITAGLWGFLMLQGHALAISFRLPATGFHTQAQKIVILEDLPDDHKKLDISIYDPAKRNPHLSMLVGATVYKIKSTQDVSEFGQQQGPGARKILIDFSDFKTPGEYELHVGGSEIKSQKFKINDFVYWDTMQPAVKALYYQRCGQEIELRSQKIFHAPCHRKDAPFTHHEDNSREHAGMDATGGWHNGDSYDKSVTNTAITVARLMTVDEPEKAIEQKSQSGIAQRPLQLMRLDYPLNEAGLGNTDDYHHEIQIGLSWLQQMQQRQGGVYAGVTGKEPLSLFPKPLGPDDDEQPRRIQPVSTIATADVAAVFAMAARDFQGLELGYGVKSMLVAEKAWNYLSAHPVAEGSKDATKDNAHRLWAAAELYASTGTEAYHQAFIQRLSSVSVQPFSAENPAIQGMLDYVQHAPNPNPQVKTAITNTIVTMAGHIADAVEADPYGAGLSQFETQSNRLVAERANILTAAFNLTGEKRYRDAATRSASYLLGVNPLGRPFVTGLSDQSPKHPASPWLARLANNDKVIPGFMISGPNNKPTDATTPGDLGAMSYSDHVRATSSNQSTLLDTAALSGLMGALNNACNAEEREAERNKVEDNSPLNYKLAPERPGNTKKKK